jgi:hypothetical protein
VRQNCARSWTSSANGVAMSEKQIPQVIGNKQKLEEAIEGLELSRELAKQVLSQLSYTPTRCNQYTPNSLQ